VDGADAQRRGRGEQREQGKRSERPHGSGYPRNGGSDKETKGSKGREIGNGEGDAKGTMGGKRDGFEEGEVMEEDGSWTPRTAYQSGESSAAVTLPAARAAYHPLPSPVVILERDHEQRPARRS
jgi:hypothetical protein